MLHAVHTQQAFSLMAYAPVSAMQVRRVCMRAGTLPKFEFPRQVFQLRKDVRQNESLAKSFLLEAGRGWELIQAADFSMEMVAPLLSILNPSLRPVNPSVFTPEEKGTLARLVDVMNSLCLSFQRTRQVDPVTRQAKHQITLDPYVCVYVCMCVCVCVCV
jgi:hypothetical protein